LKEKDFAVNDSNIRSEIIEGKKRANTNENAKFKYGT